MAEEKTYKVVNSTALYGPDGKLMAENCTTWDGLSYESAQILNKRVIPALFEAGFQLGDEVVELKRKTRK